MVRPSHLPSLWPISFKRVISLKEKSWNIQATSILSVLHQLRKRQLTGKKKAWLTLSLIIMLPSFANMGGMPTYRLQSELYDKVRMASEVHRQVRRYAQSFIEPGIKLIDMCERLENKNRELMQVSEKQRRVFVSILYTILTHRHGSSSSSIMTGSWS